MSEEIMEMNSDDEDTLQPAYDLSKLKITGRGALRECYGSPADFRRLQAENVARTGNPAQRREQP